MADRDILIPGESTCTNMEDPNVEEIKEYLEKDNYLGEFLTPTEKELARTNLGVPALDEVYNIQQANNAISEALQKVMQQHLNADDPHAILPQVDDKLKGIVKQDGSTPFLAPQTGKDPITDYHLTTKRFVENLLQSHLKASDPHNIMTLVEEALTEYVKVSQVYFKKELYNRKEIDSKLDGYVKSDGTVPFKRPQLGIDPKSDGHLTTKRYVDELIKEHIYDVDPHGFISTLNNRLSQYYKKTDTYSKAETYSRQQLDSIINNLVRSAAIAALEEHINSYDPHGTLESIRNEHYVKRDGSVPFTKPQSGVEAVNDDHLVTLGQLKELLETKSDDGCIGWKTSGPVQTTVGFVEDNTQLPEHLTCQQVFDLIFYGKEIEVKSPEYVAAGETCTVDMYLHGATVDALSIELYQNDELLGTYAYEEFVDGHLSETSFPITEDVTIFKFKVCYMNGTCLEAVSVSKIGYFSYVGALPRWKFAELVSTKYLDDLVREDPDNNSKIAPGFDTVVQRYSFNDPIQKRRLYIVVPDSANKVLYQMSTPSQQFGIDAFEVTHTLLETYNGVMKPYTIYVYTEPLVALNNVEVTFKFDSL